MSAPIEKPQPPADGECCDSACDPCVWDHYYAELKKWRLEQVKQQQEQKNEETGQ